MHKILHEKPAFNCDVAKTNEVGISDDEKTSSSDFVSSDQVEMNITAASEQQESNEGTDFFIELDNDENGKLRTVQLPSPKIFKIYSCSNPFLVDS